VSVEQWGGAEALAGTVRRVEPGAFTKLSALGVEEQRVNVIVFLHSAPARLGDGYRVETRITRWESPSAVRVPLAALFRQGESWAVFGLANGRAVVKPVRIGPRNAEFAQVLDGLRAGDPVLLHPSDRVTDGGRVRVRAE
jgi:HlyD family secretion protein